MVYRACTHRDLDHKPCPCRKYRRQLFLPAPESWVNIQNIKTWPPLCNPTNQWTYRTKSSTTYSTRFYNNTNSIAEPPYRPAATLPDSIPSLVPCSLATLLSIPRFHSLIAMLVILFGELPLQCGCKVWGRDALRDTGCLLLHHHVCFGIL
jgi:hypothetical protein